MLNLLLIEDTNAHAIEFFNSMTAMFGSDQVKVEWVSSIKEALQFLSRNPQIDQIWLDSELSSLSSINMIATLEQLKKFAPGEVHLLVQGQPTTRIKGQYQGIHVVNNAQDEILKKVEDLLTKRSGGTTVRVSQAQLEGKIATLEVKQQDLKAMMERINQSLDRLSTVPFELESIKKFINKIPELESRVNNLVASSNEQAERSKTRWTFYGILVPAAIGAIVAITTTIVSNLDKFERFVKPTTNPPAASPSPSQKKESLEKQHEFDSPIGGGQPSYKGLSS